MDSFSVFSRLCRLCLVGRYRLSAGVLRYPLPNLAKETAPASASEGGPEGAGRGGAGGSPLAMTAPGATGNDGGASDFVAAFDEALPGGMLSHLQVRQDRATRAGDPVDRRSCAGACLLSAFAARSVDVSR